jgi:hypothetical protein
MSVNPTEALSQSSPETVQAPERADESDAEVHFGLALPVEDDKHGKLPPSSSTAPSLSTVSPKCCSELIPSFQFGAGSPTVCDSRSNCDAGEGEFEAASRHCDRLGARLCSVGEIATWAELDKDGGARCGSPEAQLVWTSTPCAVPRTGTTGFVAAARSRARPSSCLPVINSQAAIYCCADAVCDRGGETSSDPPLRCIHSHDDNGIFSCKLINDRQ